MTDDRIEKLKNNLELMNSNIAEDLENEKFYE